jgi:hypothetical protein
MPHCKAWTAGLVYFGDAVRAIIMQGNFKDILGELYVQWILCAAVKTATSSSAFLTLEGGCVCSDIDVVSKCRANSESASRYCSEAGPRDYKV